jgi:flagellar FliL protein
MSATAAEAPKTEEKPAASSGGIKAFLPLILAVVMMPALAYVMTSFVLLPKLKSALSGGAGGAAAHGEGAAAGEHGAGHEGAEKGKPKHKVPLSKIIVNVSGSGGSRMLLTSLTLAGSVGDFKSRIEENGDQLRDLASSTLASKTIADLEKPESRNHIRSELLSQFNAALGNGFVQELYITEMAIQ